MYAWIWRKLPFGLPGKLTGSVLLAGTAMAMLWFVAFPWLDPIIEERLLPWNEGQLQGEFVPEPVSPGLEPDGAPGGEPEEPGLVGPDGEELDDEHDLPYDTDSD